MVTKICTRCKQELDISQFDKQLHKKSGYTSHCKNCRAEHHKQCKNNFPDRYSREKTVNAYHNKKREAYKKLGGCCCCCGETEESFLTIDHVNDDGAEHRRCGNISGLYNHIVNGTCKYEVQLYCANCNMSKRRLGKCIHQINNLLAS